MRQNRPFARGTQKDVVTEPTDKRRHGNGKSVISQVVGSIHLPSLLGFQRSISLLVTESAVMYAVSSQFIGSGEAEATSDVHFHHVLNGGCPYQSQRKGIVTEMLSDGMTVPFIGLYLFIIISLPPKVIRQINILVRRDANITIIISHASTDRENVIRLIRRKPEQSGTRTMVLRQQK